VRETDRRKLFLLSLFLFLFGGIAILSGGLTGLRFQPGSPFPRNASAPAPEHGGTEGAYQATWLARGFQILIRVALLLGVGVGVIGAIVSPRFRRFLLHQLAPILLLILGIGLFFTFFHPGRSPITPPPPAPMEPALPAEGAGEGYTPPAVSPPQWSVVLIAFGTAGAAVGLGFAVWWRLHKRRKPEERDVLAELGTEAGAAAARIRRGAEARDAVIRAYKEMCDILSQRVENPTYLTPREFARRLRARGMQNEHVDRLTGMFEEVRYGHREGTRFAREALACLEEIRDAYANG